MLTAYDASSGTLIATSGLDNLTAKPVWIDLLFPTPEEDAAVEALLSISVPTRAEMREIEASNRLYTEQGGVFMTALVGHGGDNGSLQFSSITFILTDTTLVTVRYTEPKSFPLFVTRAGKGEAPFGTSTSILAGILEAMVQRKADLIEAVQDEVNRLGSVIFDIKGGQQTRTKRLDVALRQIGRLGEQASRSEESANSIDRMLIYLVDAMETRNDSADDIRRIEIVRRDIASLLDQLKYLSDRITFLLQAVLGMISIEQNQIIKLFSVMAVMLMPPTLVASIYGMNFKHMPELQWPLGYPAALLAMLLAAVVPFVYFRRRGWL